MKVQAFKWSYKLQTIVFPDFVLSVKVNVKPKVK